MLKDTVRTEYNSDRLEKWFGRKAGLHHVKCQFLDFRVIRGKKCMNTE